MSAQGRRGGSGGMDALERLLTLKEVAELLHVAPRTIYRLIAAGVLPQPVKVGAQSRMPASEIHAYIERLKERRQ